MPTSLMETVPIIISLISAAVAVASLLHKQRVDRETVPTQAVGNIASAASALGVAYENRLNELVERVAELTERVEALEELERCLTVAVRDLGMQVEGAGLVPVVNWRELLRTVRDSVSSGE